MGRLKVNLLGGFEARFSGGPPLSLPTKKAQALLAHLALRPGEPHPRDKVAALLWGDKEEEQARHSLRQAISAIRKALSHASPRCLLLEGDTIALASSTEVDAVRFEQYVSDGSSPALEQATQLYKGDFLEGLDVKEEMFEEWLMTERERLRELALDGSAKLLAHQLKNNLDEAAIQTALQLLGLDPLQESVHQILMRLYFKNGRRGAALMQYQRCVEVLQRELGVEPEPETKQCYQEILQRASRTPAAEAPQIRQASRRRRRVHRARPDYRTPETSLIGREPELARLRQAIGEARKGRGQTIMILGEAGIGKSHLVRELGAEAIRGGSLALVGNSYEIEQVLPFGPWINALRSGKVTEDSHVVQSLSPVWRVELARLFPELGAPGLEVSTAPENAVRLFEAMAHLTDCLVARQPLLLILEDLHWADEMSLRLFSFLSRRIEDRSVLLVGTAREEEVSQTLLLSQLLQELDRDQRVLSFTLSPLSQADTSTLVRRLGSARVEESLLAGLEQGVWASSQGNPFMIVETMRALQEGEGLEAQSGVPLPKRVRAVVAQRLERLSDRAKQLVAVAAVIGREFDYVLLERAAALGQREAAEGVEELVRRRVLHGMEERFDFTHDRIREVAYGQLLPPRPRLLHARVATALEEVYGENLEPHYAALGVHYREGRLWEKAAVYLHKAGGAAVMRSANREAAQYFEQALDAVRHFPETRETLGQAIDIRIDLGPVLRTIKRTSAPEVEQTYIQARELCQRLGETPKLFPVLWGLCRVYHSRGEFHKARELGEQLFSLAQHMQDPALILEAHHTQWSTLFSLGELLSTKEHCERGRVLYDPQQHRQHAFLYGGHDPGVCCGSHAAQVVWLLGYPDQALQRSQEALSLARELSHPYSLAFALLWAARIHKFRGELEALRERTEEALILVIEQGFPRWLMLGTILRGWLSVEHGSVEQGTGQIRQALIGQTSLAEAQSSIGFAAEAYGKAGQPEEGLSIVAEALDRARKSGLRYYEAGLHRIKGELLLTQAVPDEEEAEGCFQKALEVARSQSAKSLELRAAMSLSRLWQRQGKQKEARQLLTDIYGWFTEGFDTADLREAKALLEELR